MFSTLVRLIKGALEIFAVSIRAQPSNNDTQYRAPSMMSLKSNLQKVRVCEKIPLNYSYYYLVPFFG